MCSSDLDVTLLLCAGIASRSAPALWHPMEMAWTASLLAVLTAYIRVLGASMGAGHFFLGPMAKQHRMATLNLGIIGSIFEGFFSEKFGYSLYFSLIIISLGSAITCLRRLNAVLKNFQ